MKKATDIKKDKVSERADLMADPIKVVRGPGGALFITDHHHGADAWRVVGEPLAFCQISTRPAFTDDAAFWSGLIADKLVRLMDENGKPIMPAQLPANLERTPDDPYRSLAWRVRKDDGFCRADMQKEFAEFIWADWLRNRPELPIAKVRASAKSMKDIALIAVRGPDARGRPGYTGDKPKGFRCPKD